jgi:hypothetical protein
MFDGDCRRKFDFSSEPVGAHWALLSTLYRYDRKKVTCRATDRSAESNVFQCFLLALGLAPESLSRRNKCQVSKKAGACSGLLYSQ